MGAAALNSAFIQILHSVYSVHSVVKPTQPKPPFLPFVRFVFFVVKNSSSPNEKTGPEIGTGF